MSRVLLVCVVAALALPLALHASVAGLVPARTGGFGEMTCQQCHWENALNDPAGRLTVEGIPQAYTPGEQYPITVTLARSGIGRAGFQLSAREDGINMNAGNDAGLLAGDDDRVTVLAGKRVSYAQHSPGGVQASTGTQVWKLTWTAPVDGPVVFHVAANAANGDDSPLGDYIYTAIVTTRPAD